MAAVITGAMVLATAPVTPPGNNARIGIDSIFTLANLRSTDDGDPGFPNSAITNPLTYEAWRPALGSYIGYPVPDHIPAEVIFDAGTGKKCDYIGIAAHTLGTTGTQVTLSASLDGVGLYTPITSFVPANDDPIMVLFDAVTYRYWKLELLPPGPPVTAAGAPQVAVVYVGKLLEMPVAIYGGHAPLRLSRVTARRPNVSERGQWLGLSILRKGLRTSFAWKNLDPDWYRATFDPFVALARRLPWFIGWRPERWPYEVGYVWTTGDISPTNMGVGRLMQVTVDVEGLDVAGEAGF